MVFGLFNSRSSSNQTADNSSKDDISNAVNGDGDYNRSISAGGQNNVIHYTETDNGAIDRAFAFGSAALDSASASGQHANTLVNEVTDKAIDAARGQAANSENLLRILVTGTSIIAISYAAMKVIK